MTKEILNIVDENDNILGTEDRIVIHEKGLLHREVHVYFVTPNNEIIFQHRAKDKDTFPDLLDATVGGHVEIGDSYEETAIKEAFEETGIRISEKDLIAINKILSNSKDELSGTINHAFQKEFIYMFSGQAEDLKVEEGKALGFEIWPLEMFKDTKEADKSKFVPHVYKFTSTKLIDFIKNNAKQL